MMKELGELFGWLLVSALAGTILSFFLILINKRFGKKIAASPKGKKIMKVLLTIFVRNHIYFGLATVALLLTHFIIQFTNIGFNITGGIVAGLLIIQILYGLYAYIKKKPRKGVWFFLHRALAALIVLGIAIHLIVPYAFNSTADKDNKKQVTDTVDTSKLQVFTLEDLASFNGEDGEKAYIAYKGLVYDVTDVPAWNNGNHDGNQAGKDMTEKFSDAPHGITVLDNLPLVGKLK